MTDSTLPPSQTQSFVVQYREIDEARAPLLAKIDRLKAQVAELSNVLKIAVDSELGAKWIWPSTAKETWMRNAVTALDTAMKEKKECSD